MESTAASFRIDTAIPGLSRAAVAGWSPDGKHTVVMTAPGALGINTTWGLLDVPLQGPRYVCWVLFAALNGKWEGRLAALRASVVPWRFGEIEWVLDLGDR